MNEAKRAQTEQFIVSQLGLLPRKWRICEVGAACLLIVDCPHTTPTFRDEGILVARTTNIRDGRFVVEGASYVDEQEFRTRILRAEPQAGDVIFTREAPVGEAFVVPPGMQVCLGQRVMLLRPDPSLLDPIYLLSQISSGFVRSRIATLTAGTTNPHLNVGEVRSFLLPVPPIDEQRRIAEILGGSWVRLTRRSGRPSRSSPSLNEPNRASSGCSLLKESTNRVVSVILTAIRTSLQALRSDPGQLIGLFSSSKN